MLWGILPRLVSYVDGLPDGMIIVAQPAEPRGRSFWFPFTGGTDMWNFEGEVRLRGHGGMLDIELRDPRVEVTGDRGTLAVRNVYDGYAPFAELALIGDVITGQRVQVWAANLSDFGAGVDG